MDQLFDEVKDGVDIVRVAGIAGIRGRTVEIGVVDIGADVEVGEVTGGSVGAVGVNTARLEGVDQWLVGGGRVVRAMADDDGETFGHDVLVNGVNSLTGD